MKLDQKLLFHVYETSAGATGRRLLYEAKLLEYAHHIPIWERATTRFKLLNQLLKTRHQSASKVYSTVEVPLQLKFSRSLTSNVYGDSFEQVKIFQRAIGELMVSDMHHKAHSERNTKNQAEREISPKKRAASSPFCRWGPRPTSRTAMASQKPSKTGIGAFSLFAPAPLLSKETVRTPTTGLRSS